MGSRSLVQASRQRLRAHSVTLAACIFAASSVISFAGSSGAISPLWHLTKHYSSPIQTMTGVNCTSAKHCVVTTTNGREGATFTGWSSFSSVAAHGAHLADQMDAVSCPSPTKCIAVGTWGTATTGYGVVNSSINGGHTWSIQHVSPVPHSLAAVSCATTLVCMAVGVMGGHTEFWIRTVDGGVHWSDHTGTIDPSIGGLSSVSCVSTLICTVIGIRGEAAVTTDGGLNWNIGTAFSTVNWLYGVSCVGKGVCFAVGEDTKGHGLGLYSPNSGLTWRQMSMPAGIAHLYGLSCLDTSHCFAVGQSAAGHGTAVRAVASTVWSAMSIPSGTNVLNSIDCLSLTWCTAVGGDSSNNAMVLTMHP